MTKNKNHNSIIANLIFRLFNAIWNFFRSIRKKYLAFIFFVGLSTIAWFLRALSDDYIADIEYPVKYINLPPNRMLSRPPLEKLTLLVESDGYTILSSRIKYKKPLSYNINAFALYSLTEDSTSVYTLTRYAKEKLTDELNISNKNIKIIDIDPDTLIFNFSRVKRKKVPIVVNLEETPELFRQQHMLNGEPYTDPAYADVTGPSYIIDTLSCIFTRKLKAHNLSDTTERRVHLQGIKRVTIPQSKVKVIIPVDEFTESEYTLPVIALNVPDSLTLKSFPKNVRVKYQVTLHNYEKVSQSLFRVSVDYNDIESEHTARLKVELDPLPSFIQNVSIHPRNIEFLIEK
jgi:hypothetical protein